MAAARSAAELEALLERVRRFIDETVIPSEDLRIAHDSDRLEAQIRGLRERARELGLLGPQLKRELGGLGLSWEECCPIFDEAGRSFLGPGALHCAAPGQPDIALLDRLATPDQRTKYLVPLARGEIRSCFAMSEPPPGVGSDPRMLQATARRDRDGWVLDGHKWMASGAIGAAFALVMARTGTGASLFIVDAGNPGFRLVRAVPTMEAFSVGGHGEVRLESCRVGGEALVGEEGKGFDYAQLRLEGARLFHSMRFIGLASRAMEIAQDYAARRESYGARLSEHQLVQAMVADSHIDLYACRLMTLDVARRLDAGESIRHQSSMAKVFVAEAVNRVADRAVQMTGALGISEDAPLSMILRQVRPFRIYDGASEVHRAAIGRRAFQKRLRA